MFYQESQLRIAPSRWLLLFIDIFIIMMYYTCRICDEYLSEDNYYCYIRNGKKRPHRRNCKQCQCEMDRENYEKIRLKGSGGKRTPRKPNTYDDEIQKEQTFQFLTLMGWKFNEEKGIWYDDIKKDKDGNMIGVWEKKKRIYKTVLKNENGKKIYTRSEDKKRDPFYIPIVIIKGQFKEVPQNILDSIQYDYFIENKFLDDINEKYKEYGNLANYVIKRSLTLKQNFKKNAKKE